MSTFKRSTNIQCLIRTLQVCHGEYEDSEHTQTSCLSWNIAQLKALEGTMLLAKPSFRISVGRYLYFPTYEQRLLPIKISPTLATEVPRIMKLRHPLHPQIDFTRVFFRHRQTTRSWPWCNY